MSIQERIHSTAGFVLRSRDCAFEPLWSPSQLHCNTMCLACSVSRFVIDVPRIRDLVCNGTLLSFALMRTESPTTIPARTTPCTFNTASFQQPRPVALTLHIKSFLGHLFPILFLRTRDNLLESLSWKQWVSLNPARILGVHVIHPEEIDSGHVSVSMKCAPASPVTASTWLTTTTNLCTCDTLMCTTVLRLDLKHGQL